MKRSDIMRKWIEALRSGEYKQGTLFLNKYGKGEYCCLGVLVEICHPKVKWNDGGFPSTQKWKLDDSTYYAGEDDWLEKIIYSELKIDGRKHRKVYEVIGWEKEFGNMEEQHLSGTLTYLNDGGANFDQIANFLEDCVLPVVVRKWG